MAHNPIAGLTQFLEEYPGMALRPSRDPHTRLKGTFRFRAHHEAAGEIADSFKLEILIPRTFPKDLPTIYEIGGRIPRHNASFHVNQTDGSLCLGSPIGLLLILAKRPSLVGFSEGCLIPYLYAISHKLAHGGALPFGELAHGNPGIISDYMAIFHLQSPYQVQQVLNALGMKKRTANKYPCPCGCGLRLGKCKFNRLLAPFRKLVSRTMV